MFTIKKSHLDEVSRKKNIEKIKKLFVKPTDHFLESRLIDL